MSSLRPSRSPLTPTARPSPWIYQAVLLAEPGNALGLEVVAIAGTEFGEVGHLCHADRLRRGHLLAELVEEVLESGRRDDLQEPAGRVTSVPERVPLVSRLEHEVARLGVHHVVAQLRA